MFPAWLLDDGLGVETDGIQRRPNLSGAAQHYLQCIGANVEDLFHHVLSVLHDPAYREANAGALRMEWPRIPVPGWQDGDEVGGADELAESAARGRELAALLDSDTPVPGVTTGMLKQELAVIAVPYTMDGGNMDGDDFDVTAGWSHFGAGQGRRASVDVGGARGARRRCLDARRLDARRLSQRPGVLAQRVGQRVELQTRGLPGTQEVAVIPRAQGAGDVAAAGRGAAVRGDGKAYIGGTAHCCRRTKRVLVVPWESLVE